MQQLTRPFDWTNLFNDSPYSLRFELGGNHAMGPIRFLQAIDRARSVAEFVFAESEKLTVGIRYVGRKVSPRLPAEMLRTLRKFEFSGSIGPAIREEPEDEVDIQNEAEGSFRYRCALEIDNSKEQVALFLWASVASEMGISPRLGDLYWNYITDVERGIILHVYDDRGMDVAGIRRELLQPCYEKFKEWLLEYDRPQIEATFSPPA